MLLVFRSVCNRVGLLLDRFGFFFSNLNFYLGGVYLLKQPSEAVLLCFLTLKSTRGGIQWNDFPFQFYILKCALVYVLISRTFRHFILHCFWGPRYSGS